jgi:hypothetical protein
MRVFRTILGMLLLTTGLPALLAGGGLWAVMQHRDPGGAFSGELQRLTVPGYAVVVPDIDRLLRDDVPFARIGDTQLRLSAVTVDGPAFLGLAPADEVTRYLTGVPYSQIDAIDIGTGALPVTTTRAGGRQAPAGPPGQQPIWIASGTGQISITPGELLDRPYSLVLMNPGGGPVMRLATIAEIRPGWLNPSTWGLLTLGTLLVMLGVTALVWPGRRREVVYVVEPGQVPELMHAIGAPLPLPGGVAYFAGGRSGGAHRPRTLADSRPRPPALPQFAWPPNAPELPSGGAVPLNAATITKPIPSGTPAGPTDEPSPAAPSALAHPAPSGEPASATFAVGSAFTGGAKAGPASMPGAAPVGARTPAPGQPLSLLGETPALAGFQPGSVPARRGERRPNPADLPQFQATAVGAWVAATAPERARQTEARAAARLAEAARRNAGKFAPTQAGTRNMPGNTRIPIATPRRDDGETPAPPPPPPATTANPAATPQPEAASTTTAETAPTTTTGVAPGPLKKAKPAPAPTPPDATRAPSPAEPKAASATSPAETKPAPATSPAEAVAASVTSPAEVKAAPATSPVEAEAALTGSPSETRSTSRSVSAEEAEGATVSESAAGAVGTPATALVEEPAAAHAADGSTAGTAVATPVEPALAAPVVSRIALRTGPAATDWTATGITEIGPVAAPRRGSRPSPKPTGAGRPADPAPVIEPEPERAAITKSTAESNEEADTDGGESVAPEPAESKSPKPGSSGVGSAGPESKSPKLESSGLGSAGPESPMPESVGLGSANSKSAESMSSEPESMGQGSVAPEPAGVRSAESESTEAESREPEPGEPSSAKPEPAVSEPATATVGSPPEWPLIGDAARRADATGPGDVPKVIARHVTPRTSLHAEEAANAVPDPSGPGDERAVSAGSGGESVVSAGSGGERAASAGQAAVPAPARALPRPGKGRRSVHTVEADGLGVLPKKPAPVPTRGTTVAAPAAADDPKPEASVAKPAASGSGKASARKATGAKSDDDRPLARAQGRTTGKAAPTRQAPAARRAPAAWIKAAESMAARTGQAGGGTASAVPAMEAGEPRATGVPAMEAGESRATGVPAMEAGESRATGDQGRREAAARPLSYREEAAELLGGERRRRRTVAGQNRPKPEPRRGDAEGPEGDS